jgi:alpha,alpha-trehalose phosphorylase
VTGRVDRLRRSGFAVAALATGGCDATVAPGESLICDCLAAYAALQGPDSAATALAAATAALSAARDGFDRLAAEQADWFSAYWQDADIAFDDTPRATQALRHALFQLVQAVGRDGTSSIGAKGQTGEGYEGHVFWDADSYVLPAFVFLRPAIARSMLQWRIARLEAARGNARAMGHERGALYPWRTIAGAECSSFFPAGSAQYHINADIAHALKLYVDATGDRTILAEGGAAMLAETARIWLEIGFHDPDRDHAFVINRVTGPDEYSAIVDNNLYTNLMAAAHLRFATAVARQPGFADLLSEAEIAAMDRAAEKMLLPHDARRDLYAQDEGFFGKQPWPFEATGAAHYPLLMHFHPLTIYRHQVAKQADAILALAVLRDAFDPAMRARMLHAYEAVTVHDSTLSASAFATAAAGVGDAARAAAYWRASALTDLCDLFGNSDHGLHMAALAGSWTALAMGFAGMRADDDGLSFAPIAVPEIGAYRFRLHYRDRQIEVAVRGDGVEYRLISGDALAVTEHGSSFILQPGQAVSRPLAA